MDIQKNKQLDTEQLLTQINDRLNSPQYTVWLIYGGVALSLGAGMVNIWLALPVALLCGATVHFAHLADHKRRIFAMTYYESDMRSDRWKAATNAISTLAESQKLWLIHGSYSTADWKRNSGATELISRSVVSILKASPPFIETNVTPICLNLGPQQLYFLPDRVYVYRSQKYAVVSYDTLTMESEIIEFHETGILPKDTQQVGQSWRYVNMDGSPDGRFSQNSPVPIVLYGVLKLALRDNLIFTLHVSMAKAAMSAVAKFQIGNTDTSSQHHSQYSRSSSYSHQRQQNQSPPHSPKPKSVPDCYTVLSLSLTCTQEEASVGYRNLAKQYHPDKVSHLAPEFQRMAEDKMKEFNNAYTEIKKLRGW